MTEINALKLLQDIESLWLQALRAHNAMYTHHLNLSSSLSLNYDEFVPHVNSSKNTLHKTDVCFRDVRVLTLKSV